MLGDHVRLAEPNADLIIRYHVPGLAKPPPAATKERNRLSVRGHGLVRLGVRTIRSRLDTTQEEFAGRFGFSVATNSVEEYRSASSDMEWAVPQFTREQVNAAGRVSFAQGRLT